MGNNINKDKVNVYLPIRNQATQIATALIVFLIFGVVQWIRADEPGQLSLVDYWLYSLPAIPNDYKLIVILSALSLLLILIFTFTSLIDRNKINPFMLGALGIIPTIGNLIILLYFFYLIFYRGLWSLSEFKSGFSFCPILKVLLFAGIGIYGYNGFSHFYQLKKLLQQKKLLSLLTMLSSINYKKCKILTIIRRLSYVASRRIYSQLLFANRLWFLPM